MRMREASQRYDYVASPSFSLILRGFSLPFLVDLATINLSTMPRPPPPGPPSAFGRYLQVLRSVRAHRGERCECCGAPTRAAHHINAVGIQGIASGLTFEASNLLLVCGHCHSLFHPGQRSYPFEVDGRPAPSPRAPPRDALHAVYVELLAIERERLQVAVKIERERGFVVRFLAEKVYGPAPSTGRKASGAPGETSGEGAGPAVAGPPPDEDGGDDDLDELLSELGADDGAELGEP